MLSLRSRAPGELAPGGVVKFTRNLELRVVLERERGAERAVRQVRSLGEGVAQVAERRSRPRRGRLSGVDARARKQEGATLDPKHRFARVALHEFFHLALAGGRPLDALTGRLQHVRLARDRMPRASSNTTWNSSFQSLTLKLCLLPVGTSEALELGVRDDHLIAGKEDVGVAALLLDLRVVGVVEIVDRSKA